MANDFNYVLATCQRFQDIATWDPERFNANVALARIAELHNREIAAKDVERKGILKANESLAADNTRLRGELAAKDAEIARLKACHDGDCERIRLGAEPCEGCHVQIARDEIDKLRALVKELTDALQGCVKALETIYDEECTDYGTEGAYDKAIEVCTKAREVVK